jgi:hypothetical protein
MRCLVAIALFWLAGCGPSEPVLYPVTGTLKLADGKSPAGCVVEFSSQGGETKGLNARSEVAADGTFTLVTLVNGKEKPGAVAGLHKVAVVPPPASSSGGPPPPAIAPKYLDYNTSGLTFEVKPGENKYPITVDAK